MDIKNCKVGDVIEFEGRTGKVRATKVSAVTGHKLALVETGHPNHPDESIDLETGRVRAQYGQGISLARWLKGG